MLKRLTITIAAVVIATLTGVVHASTGTSDVSVADAAPPGAAYTLPAAPLTICNKAPYKVDVSLLYLAEQAPDRWDIEGWWTVDAGNCVDLRKGVRAQFTYVYARAASEVPVWLYGAPQHWAGTDLYACVWIGSHPFLFQGHQTCPSSSKPGETGVSERYGFRKVMTNGQPFTYTLLDSGFDVKTLKDAATAGYALAGRAEFERIVFSKPVKAPFRIGLEWDPTPSDLPGIAIKKVYGGLPAAEAVLEGGGTGLRPGDRIFLVNDQPIEKPIDAIKAINEYGFTHDAPRWINVTFIRGEKLEVLSANLYLEYYYELDPRRTTVGGAQAGASAFIDSVFLGFSSQVICWIRSQLSRAVDYQACVANHERELARREERYPNHYKVGDLSGMLVSITRGILKGVIKNPRILGSRTLGRIGSNAAIEAGEGMATVLGQARPGEDPVQLIKRLKAAGKLGAIVGAGTGAVFK